MSDNYKETRKKYRENNREEINAKNKLRDNIVINVRVTLAEKNNYKKLAKRRGMSLSEIVREKLNKECGE